MRLDAAFRGHEGRVGEDDIGEVVPAFFAGEGVIFENVRVGEAVQVEVHQREAHHVGRDVVALEVFGEAALVVGGQRAVALGVGVGFEDVFIGGDKEPGGAAGGVEDGFAFLWGENFDHEIDDVARGAELAGIALAAEHGEQILEGVTETLAVVVCKFVDDFEKRFQRLGVAVGQVGVLENVAEQRRDAGILRHFGDAFGIEVERFMAAEAAAHELGPAVAGEVAGEKLALAAEFLALGVHVVHELVDQGDGDLFDLAFWVGDFTDEDVAGGVDAAFGGGVEHGLFLELLDYRPRGEHLHLADGDFVEAFEALAL